MADADVDEYTNCELCCEEIHADEVELCPTCGQDGICNDCLMDHKCEAKYV